MLSPRMRAFLRGAGSLLDIWPDPATLQALIPKGSAEQRLRRHWEQVGRYLWTAMDQLDEEAAKQDQEARKAGIAKRRP